MGSAILRNLVGATSFHELRQIEDDLVAVRAHEAIARGIPHTYDLSGLQEIPGHLFQDVYEWAGQIRTVLIG